MPGTGKGIYVKSNPHCGKDVDRFGRLVEKRSLIEGIMYEDVNIIKPWWWSIWIGPQQQHEPGSGLGDKCAIIYPLAGTPCPTQGCATFANLTLRNVLIHDPLLSPGVILGNATQPMSNIVFDNVRVLPGSNPLRGRFPFGARFQCKHAQVHSLGGTSPEPECE